MALFSLDGFTLNFPEQWSTRLLAVVGPQEQFGRGEAHYQANVIVAVEKLEKSIDASSFLESQLDDLKKGLQGFRELKRETLDIAGEKAALIEFSFLSPEGQMLRQMNVYRPMPNKKMLVMNASHLLGPRFDKARKGYLEIITSLAILPEGKKPLPKV